MSRKYKIPDYQNGHAYLTSHRVCYVAAEEPRKFSLGIDLKEIDRAEYQVVPRSTIRLLCSLTDWNVTLGGFLQVIAQDHHIS